MQKFKSISISVEAHTKLVQKLGYKVTFAEYIDKLLKITPKKNYIKKRGKINFLKWELDIEEYNNMYGKNIVR